MEKIENQMAKSMFKTQLHDGEVEVMILAKEKNADIVIIDDANAKKHVDKNIYISEKVMRLCLEQVNEEM